GRAAPEMRCVVQQQGVVRHEEERAGIVICRTVMPPKFIARDLCDSLGAQVEHDFVMRLQRLAEPREVNHHDASCHGRQSFTYTCDRRWPLSGNPGMNSRAVAESRIMVSAFAIRHALSR